MVVTGIPECGLVGWSDKGGGRRGWGLTTSNTVSKCNQPVVGHMESDCTIKMDIDTDKDIDYHHLNDYALKMGGDVNFFFTSSLLAKWRAKGQ